MLQYGWLVFALIFLVPLFGLFILDRMGVGRLGNAIGITALLASSVALLLHGAGYTTKLRVIDLPMMTFAPASRQGDQNASSDNAGAQTAALALERLQTDLSEARAQLAAAEAQRTNAQASLEKITAELASERSSHNKTRLELGGVKGHLKSLEASLAGAMGAGAEVMRLQSELEAQRAETQKLRAAVQKNVALTEGAVDTRLKARQAEVASLEARLSQQQAADEQIKAELQAAKEKIVGLERNRLALEEQLRSSESKRDTQAAKVGRISDGLEKAIATIARLEAAQKEAAQIAGAGAVTGAAGAGPPPAGAKPGAAPSALMDQLNKGMKGAGFDLSLVAERELVEGLAGSYYRVACLDGKGQRLTFSSSTYYPSDSDARFIACFTALREAVLSKLPPSAEVRVFAQGFVSDQKFARPRPIPASDTQMRSVQFLPKSGVGGRYAAKVQIQNVRSFTNKELMTLRGAYVVDILKSTGKNAPSMAVLEGDVKPASDPASTSFDLIVYANWQVTKSR